MKRILWAFILGVLMPLPLQAWGEPEDARMHTPYNQAQYELLMQCATKGDMTEWNEWVLSIIGKNGLVADIQLQEANLSGANLESAILYAADLRNADLFFANLRHADLREADLRGAILSKGILLANLGFDNCPVRNTHDGMPRTSKPVIYLYPEQTTEVTVKLEYNGTLEYTYPTYNDGWLVMAQPDGTLTNYADGREYSYLFWDGITDVDYDFSRGFIVKGSDTVTFLQEKLAFMGLTPREYNEFIVYWLPYMQRNPWNLIAFQEKRYTDNAVLTIEPKPDSILRVFMAFRPLQEPLDIPEQTLKPFERKGFTVVEWGGSECN